MLSRPQGRLHGSFALLLGRLTNSLLCVPCEVHLVQYWRSMAHLSCRGCNFSIGASSGLCWNGYACVVSDPIGYDVPSARYRQRLSTQFTEKSGVGVQMHRKSAFLLHCDSIGHICCDMALTASRCSTLHRWTNPQRLVSSTAEFPLILLRYAWSVATPPGVLTSSMLGHDPFKLSAWTEL